MPTRSDTELVVLARTTEPDAYGELFDRWYESVHALVFAAKSCSSHVSIGPNGMRLESSESRQTK